MGLSDFYKLYQEKRNCLLDENQFSSMLAMFPGALVAYADGDFGALEKENLVSALKEAANEAPVVMCEMYAELCYLVHADKDMKDAVLQCVKTEIAEKEDLKKIVLDIMISTAESENGISQVEQEKIDEIKSILSL